MTCITTRLTVICIEGFNFVSFVSNESDAKEKVFKRQFFALQQQQASPRSFYNRVFRLEPYCVRSGNFV